MARNKYDVDEELEVEFNFGHLKRLLRYLKPHKKTVGYVIFLMLLSSIIAVVGPYLIKDAIDTRIPNKDYVGLFISAGIYLGCCIAAVLISRRRVLDMTRIGQNIVLDLRTDVFNHLQELPFTYFDSRPHGKIMVRVVNYVNSISDLISNGLVNLITDLFVLIVTAVIMFVVNYKLALICLIPLPIFVIVVFSLKRKHRKAWQNYSSKNSNQNAYIHESIAGMKVTKAFGREARNLKIFRGVQKECRDAWMGAQKIQLWFWPMVEVASTISTVLLFVFGILWLVGPEISDSIFTPGIVTIGTIFAFRSYVSMFWNPIINIANFYNTFTTTMAYLERVFELLDEKPNIVDAPDAQELPSIEGTVDFCDVHFAYEPNKMILDGVSFHVNPGETIALVGPTGAGKTTIINLLSRFYDVNSGTILIDGHDISKVTLRSLRKQMGVMLQDTFIFAGTVMDNIKYGKLDATDEEAMEAAKVVCAHDFILQLENGYQTEVNERGSRLSVGQRQLISFARALLADPKILILDEATSSIDTETEMALQKGLDRLLEGRTSFVIAHRLSTIKNADKIMYVDKKHIIEAGTHDELMELEGAYYNLYRAQYAFLEEN